MKNPPTNPEAPKERTLKTETVFSGRLLTVERLQVELENGQRSVREVVRHPGAVVVLAREPAGRFVLVRQFRKPIERDLLEVVAGTREPDESAADCARRELTEETGYRAGRLVALGELVPAPGYTDERLTVFFAEVDDDRSAGAPDEDEKIDVVLLDRDQIETFIAAGELTDAKTLAAWLLYLRRIEA